MNPYQIIAKRKKSIFYCISPSIVFFALQIALVIVAVIISEIGPSRYNFLLDLSENIYTYMIPIHIAIIFIYFITFRKNEKKSFDNLFENKMSFIDIIMMTILGISLHALVTLFFMMLSFLINGYIISGFGGYSFSSLPIQILTVGIFGPIAEELLCRASIFNRLRMRGSEKSAILISSLIFGIMHLNLTQASYAFVLGVIQAAAYIKYENILAPTIIHITFNMANFIYMTPVSQILLYSEIIFTVCMAGLFLLSLRFLVKRRKADRKPDITLNI